MMLLSVLNLILELITALVVCADSMFYKKYMLISLVIKLPL